jgi:acyl dehydratase
MTDLSYDAIEIGTQYGPWKYPLADRIARHLEAVENNHPWHHERSPWGPPVAPPAILGQAGLRFLTSIAPLPPGTLHARQEIATAAALRLDRKPILYGAFTEKYERRGRRRAVFEARCRDETGLIIGRSRVTITFPEKVETPEEPRGRAATARVKTERQGEFDPIVRTLTQEKMSAFSEEATAEAPRPSIHTSLEVAKAAGFEVTVAQGLMCADYISEMMTKLLGKEWYELANLSLAFLRPALCGDTLTANGRLSESVVQGGVVRRLYQVWCENQLGEAVAAGTASSLVMRPALIHP